MNAVCYVAYKEYFQYRAEDIFSDNGVTDADILVYSPEAIAQLPGCGYLALLARGGTAEELRQQLDIPVVEIPVSFQDITAALLEASRYGRKIGVVGYRNVLGHLDQLNPILNVEITQVIATSAEDTRKAIESLCAHGIDVIVGGFLQVEIAAQLGIRHVLLDLYEDSLLEAYHQARTIAESVLRNARKQEEINTILNTTKEAFLAVDLAGRVTVVNQAARRLSRRREKDIMGQPLESVFPTMTGLLEVLETQRERLREPLTIGETTILCDMIPLQIRDGQPVGAMASFSDIDSITKSEHALRSKLYGSGLYATYTFDCIIYKSKLMGNLLHTARRYAAADSAVLILGETGVGKELFAQSIHNASDRRKGPFVAINCASIPESILESELFGYEEGAFTGAKKNGKPGFFELAHKGTIFLDEIGEMPIWLQARLLRVLQEKRVMRLGGSQIIPIDVRIIAATNKDLSTLIREDKFRTDLFYRLNVLTLPVPPLRQRSEDIPILVEDYLRRNGFDLTLTRNAEEALCQGDWPGNIRQLFNFVERLYVIHGSREVDEQTVRTLLATETHAPASVEPPVEPTPHRKRTVVTRETLLDTLNRFGGSREAAAEALGIHRSTLWRLLKKYNIKD